MAATKNIGLHLRRKKRRASGGKKEKVSAGKLRLKLNVIKECLSQWRARAKTRLRAYSLFNLKPYQEMKGLLMEKGYYRHAEGFLAKFNQGN
jgi:hypothetical protein